MILGGEHRRSSSLIRFKLKGILKLRPKAAQGSNKRFFLGPDTVKAAQGPKRLKKIIQKLRETVQGPKKIVCHPPRRRRVQEKIKKKGEGCFPLPICPSKRRVTFPNFEGLLPLLVIFFEAFPN